MRMGIGWKPVRLTGWNDPERARLAREPEDQMEAQEVIQAHTGGPLPEERRLTTHWREEVSKDGFVAALRAMADALSQEQNFTFTVDHRFMVMRPLGTPSIEYYERADQRKEIVFRFSWRA